MIQVLGFGILGAGLGTFLVRRDWFGLVGGIIQAHLGLCVVAWETTRNPVVVLLLFSLGILEVGLGWAVGVRLFYVRKNTLLVGLGLPRSGGEADDIL